MTLYERFTRNHISRIERCMKNGHNEAAVKWLVERAIPSYNQIADELTVTERVELSDYLANLARDLGVQ